MHICWIGIVSPQAPHYLIECGQGKPFPVPDRKTKSELLRKTPELQITNSELLTNSTRRKIGRPDIELGFSLNLQLG
jgi:hypothetical protein